MNKLLSLALVAVFAFISLGAVSTASANTLGSKSSSFAAAAKHKKHWRKHHHRRHHRRHHKK